MNNRSQFRKLSASVAITTKMIRSRSTGSPSIRAECENGVQKITVPYDYGLEGNENHAAAAIALARKNDFDGGEMHMGSTRDGYVFVFTHKESRVMRDFVEGESK